MMESVSAWVDDPGLGDKHVAFLQNLHKIQATILALDMSHCRSRLDCQYISAEDPGSVSR